jgi:molecular chaperone DnaK
MKDVEEAMKGSDKDAITSKTEELGKASQKLGEKVYAAMAEKEQAAQAGGDNAKPKDDNVVDADFKEVNDKK